MTKIMFSGLFILIVSITYYTCFPNKKAVYIDNNSEIGQLQIAHPTKVFLSDASQILLPDGFRVKNKVLHGTGIKYNLVGSTGRGKYYQIPLDSIDAMTYYELESSGASSFASFLLTLYGIVFFPTSIYCISCPKCCFGSCPTVYIDDSLNAELFSYSISRYFQETDLDKIYFNPTNNKNLKIRIANEALETHYINQLEVIQINHPEGTCAYSTQNENFIVINNQKMPSSAINSINHDISQFINKKDQFCYRSDSLFSARLEQKKLTDWLEIEINPKIKSDQINLILRLRNTLLTTVLFYDLVLESQGIFAIDWTAKMQTDYLYAKVFNKIYQEHAGIRFYVYENDTWIFKTRIGDVGPIAWKDVAVEIPVNPKQENIKIRLQFFPDNFMIDYIGYSTLLCDNREIKTTILESDTIFSDDRINKPDIRKFVSKYDDEYLITNPGQSYYFIFKPEDTGVQTSSFFLRSKGYYIEWLRGNWISSQNSSFKFNLFNTDATISYLHERWQVDRPLLEKEFFKNRIPLKESL